MLEKRTRLLLLPVAVHVLAMSLLPHKEVRFLFYIVPLVNVVAGVGLARAVNRFEKQEAPLYVAGTLLVVSYVASIVFLSISSINYPGGDAMRFLARTEAPRVAASGIEPYVHIDAEAAMSGVSQFLELGDPWRYSKDESLTDDADFAQFTHLISSQPRPGFKLIRPINSYDRVQLLPFRVLKRARMGVYRAVSLDWIAGDDGGDTTGAGKAVVDIVDEVEPDGDVGIDDEL